MFQDSVRLEEHLSWPLAHRFSTNAGAIGLQLRDAVVSSVRGSEEGDAPLRAVQAIY